MKIRFLAMQRKTEKHLFTVEEKPSGDLLIGFPPFGFNAYRGKSLGSASARKISVHVSPNSKPPVRTITHELVLSSKRKHKGHSVVTIPPTDYFIWPVISEVYGTNLKPFKVKSAYKNDETIKLGAYDDRSSVLVLHIVATDPMCTLPPASGLNVYRVAFREFALHILYNFADVPSTPNSFSSIIYTSCIAEDIPIIGTRLNSSAATSFHLLESELLDTSLRLLDKQRQRRASLLIIQPPSIPLMFRFPQSWPHGISIEEALYGINPIIGATRNPSGTRISNHSYDHRFSGQGIVPFNIELSYLTKT